MSLFCGDFCSIFQAENGVHEMQNTARFRLFITRPDKAGWLTIKKVPWWRGGGNEHFLVPNIEDGDQLTEAEARKNKELHAKYTSATSIEQHEVVV